MSLDPVKLARARTACVVSDRNHISQLIEFCTSLLADNRARFKHRAPLILLGRNEEGLRLAVQEACSRLSDVTCLWAKLLDAPADEIVSQLILADANAEGRA